MKKKALLLRGLATLLLLFSLLGCRKELLDSLPLRKVLVKVDWSKAKEIPNGIHVYFYPCNKYFQPSFFQLPADGGIIEVFAGEYDVIVMNDDSESYEFRELNSFSKSQAQVFGVSRGGYSSPSVVSPQPTIDCGDELFVDKKFFIRVPFEEPEEPIVLPVRPDPYSMKYYVYGEVIGMEYVSTIQGSITSMQESVLLHNRSQQGRLATVLFDFQKKMSDYSGEFFTLGVFDGPSPGCYIAVDIRLINGVKARYTFDVTSVVRQTNIIHLPTITIQFEPVDGDNGGFVPDIGDWEDVEVTLPFG